MKFDRQNALPTSDEITRFERERGVELPDAYRDFLLRLNGGRPAEENAFVGDWLVLETLYGLTQNPEHSIATQRFNNFSDHIHKLLLPIGYAGASSLYLDLRDGPMHGKIYVMGRPPNEELLIDDKGFQGEGDYEEALFVHPVADDFGGFIAMLKPPPE